MDVLDAQIHILEPDTPEYPWTPTPEVAPILRDNEAIRNVLTLVNVDDTVKTLDQAGVAGAIVVALPHYGWGPERQVNVAEKYPDKFRLIGLIDPNAPDVGEQIEEWRGNPFSAGTRLVLLNALGGARAANDVGQYLRAAERCGLPVCVQADDLSDIETMARQHPGLQLVLDHLGLPVVLVHDQAVDPFKELPAVLSLARFENIAIKMTGTASLSAQPFPFRDLWPALHQVIDRFGPERVMWGTDWTRVRNASYREAVEAFTATDELSVGEKESILSGTTRKIFRWPRSPGGGPL